MFDHWPINRIYFFVARIALSWNYNIWSAGRIAFAGKRGRGGRKQRNFAPKDAIYFVSKFHHFPKWNKNIKNKKNQITVRIGAAEIPTCINFKNCYRNRFSIAVNATIVRNYISTLINFENISIDNFGKKALSTEERQSLLRERLSIFLTSILIFYYRFTDQGI